MTISDTQTSVLIVGAGPSGLMMAAQLLRYGVQPIIIDSKQGPTTESKALAVQARSLEIYRQMGIADRVLAEGKQASGVACFIDGRVAASLSLTDVGAEQTAFPYLLLYPQSSNEKLLLDFLTLHCCPVYWQTNLVSLTQVGGQVWVQVQNDGKLSTLTCDYVVGADGAHSVVRKQLGLSFTGDTYPHQFYLADVKLANSGFAGNEIKLFFEGNKFAGFFPMPEENRFRIIGNLSDPHQQNLQLEDVLPAITNIIGVTPTVAKNYWFTTYKLHHRMADKFSRQNCFLIGDAAHIHSPVGGQGMNTGLQDAYNLAWKLAGVVNKKFKPDILDSYAAERMPVAKQLLGTTDKVFNLILSGNVLVRLSRKFIFPRLMKWIWSKDNFRETFFARLSQTAIHYRESNLNLNISASAKIIAGDRLPYLKVFDEKKQEETDLQQWCSKPGFTLIVLGKLSDLSLFTLARWLTQHYPALLNFFYLPPSVKNQHIFNAFEIPANQAKSVIVRPDMYIGFLNDKVDMVLMDNYLQNIAGMVKEFSTGDLS